METATGDLWRNPITADRRRETAERVRLLLPDAAGVPLERLDPLLHYFASVPERFQDQQAYRRYLDFLTGLHAEQPTDLQRFLESCCGDLDVALSSLDTINAVDWHDDSLDVDEWGKALFIEREVHPGYLRLIEGVYCPLMRLVAHFSRLRRAKSTQGLGLYSIVQELEGTGFAKEAEHYHNVVRNAIAHGGVSYSLRTVKYRDDRGSTEELTFREAVQLFDGLLDACNGIVLALKVFLLSHAGGSYAVPPLMFLPQLRAHTWTPWWQVEGMVQSDVLQGRQLVIYARASTLDYGKVHYSAIMTGVVSEGLFPGYDRYFVAISSEIAPMGWTALDGHKLAAARRRHAETFEEYQSVVENDLVMYMPPRALPRPIAKLETWWGIAVLNWPSIGKHYRSSMGIPELLVRSASIHANGWRCVVNADVVVGDGTEEVDRALVKRCATRIIRAASSHARRATNVADAARHLPLGFAQVAVYRKDHRTRTLRGYGLGSDLICTLRIANIARIKSLDIVGSEIEEVGRIRIAWNRAWLDGELGGGARS